MCNSCGHHQLIDIVNPEILYGSYIYTSSSSPDLENHFPNYVEYLKSLSLINEDINILDVGCNDGLFLTKLRKYNTNLFGVDPAPNIQNQSAGRLYNLFSGYCTSENVSKIISENNLESFGLITANNVFAHEDDLENMLNAITLFLDKNGFFEVLRFHIFLIWLNQKLLITFIMNTLVIMGIKSLLPFLKNNGLYIYDIKRINTKVEALE